MKIIALGTGSAFTMNNYQTNFLIIRDDNRKILFDCGGDCRFSLKEAGFTYKDIDGVFISHLHGDHVGGLEWLGFAKYFDSSQYAPDLYISESLVQSLWNNVLSGGMGCLQGKITTINDFFNVRTFFNNDNFFPL
jgi:ribonuclease BN (tRNA processing enzyme)